MTSSEDLNLEDLAEETPKPRRGRPPKKAQESEPAPETKESTDETSDVDITDIMELVSDDDVKKSEELASPETVEDVEESEEKTKAITDTEGSEEKSESEEPETITVRFLDDGLLVGNKVRSKGSELTLVVGSPRYEAEFDSNGNSWISLIDDREGQLEAYGRVRFELV